MIVSRRNETGVALNTLPLKIMICFNSQAKISESGKVENATEFTYSMISSDPSLAKIKGAYTTPYYTYSVRYPGSILTSGGPEYFIPFFFDKMRFEEVLIKNSSDSFINERETLQKDSETNELTADAEDKAEMMLDNSTYNIMLTLKLLFPLKGAFHSSLMSSYHTIIKRSFNPYIFPTSTHDLNHLFSSKMAAIQVQGKPEYIQNVIWASSILDNPYYFNYIYVHNNSLNKRGELKEQLKEDELERNLNFVNNLSKFNQGNRDVFEMISENNSKIKDSKLFFLKEKIAESYSVSPIKLTKNLTIYGEKGEQPFDRELLKKNLENDKISRETADEIFTLVNTIIKIYTSIQEHNKAAEKSSVGTPKYQMDANLSSFLNRIYQDAVEVYGTRTAISRFVNGYDKYMDLNTKNESGEDKSIIETDVIKFIQSKNKIYVELNNAIGNGLKAVIKPARISNNPKLRKIIEQVQKPDSIFDKSTPVSECASTSTEDFFRDVYSKYIFRNKGYHDIDKENMFTGVSICASGETRNYEIFVVMDTINKDKYENGDHAKCRAWDDIVSNSFENAITSKSDYRIPMIRSHTSLDEATITAPPQQRPAQLGGKKTKRQYSNKNKIGTRFLTRTQK